VNSAAGCSQGFDLVFVADVVGVILVGILRHLITAEGFPGGDVLQQGPPATPQPDTSVISEHGFKGGCRGPVSLRGTTVQRSSGSFRSASFILYRSA